LDELPPKTEVTIDVALKKEECQVLPL